MIRGLKHVSVSTALFEKMKKAQQDANAVGVFNCDVKRSALSTDELEIVLNHKSDIVSSSKKFKVDSTSQSNVSLSQLPVLAINQLVSTCFKVTKVQGPVQVTFKTKLLTKQVCTISDATGIALMVLWESEVCTLKEGISYDLGDIRVKQFNDIKYFSATINTTISATDDIEEVVSESLPPNPC
uniref:Replication protein A OB domain-containing protein n=1 Tax=Amphimedon queenslandica TaxID=400682 RepID=A0A1X7V345_AMPQE